MRVINQIFIVVALTSCTGALALGVWTMVEKACGSRKPDLVYLVLRLVCALYILPVGYVLIQLTKKTGYLRFAGAWQWNFTVTRLMGFIIVPVEALGLFVLVRNFMLFLKSIVDMKAIRSGMFPEDDETAGRVFAEMRRRLGIHGHVRLRRSETAVSPMIVGILRPMIILPCREYTREQLEVIYCHELLHHKSHDILYHVCARYVSMVPFGGLWRNLPKTVREWSERYCDYRAIRVLGAEDDGRHYFDMIVEVMRGARRAAVEESIYPMLCEDSSGLERRIDIMHNFRDIKTLAKGTAALCAAAFIFANVTTVYAAGNLMAGASDSLYEMTIEQAQQAGAGGEDELEEVVRPGNETLLANIIYANPELEEIAPCLDSNSAVAINWTVPGNTLMVSNQFWISKGKHIVVSASATPAGKTFRIGIMEASSSDNYYVEGTNGLTYTFTTPSTGFYRVTVENMTSVSINAVGSYYWY